MGYVINDWDEKTQGEKNIVYKGLLRDVETQGKNLLDATMEVLWEV